MFSITVKIDHFVLHVQLDEMSLPKSWHCRFSFFSSQHFINLSSRHLPWVFEVGVSQRGLHVRLSCDRLNPASVSRHILICYLCCEDIQVVQHVAQEEVFHHGQQQDLLLKLMALWSLTRSLFNCWITLGYLSHAFCLLFCPGYRASKSWLVLWTWFPEQGTLKLLFLWYLYVIGHFCSRVNLVLIVLKACLF